MKLAMRYLLSLSLGLLLLAPLAMRGAPQTQPTANSDDLVKHGEYLTRVADCAACHNASDGTAWVGGRRFVLPFGVLYSPNITPDKETGIGAYTDDQWVRMMHAGVGRGGKHLYPAMPYNSYTRMTRDDALAIKAYLFSLPAVHATAPPNRMRFPFNQRWLMVFWNLFNNPGKRLQPDASKSAVWNRGAYLVEALGHCEQCHTPRNFMQGISGRAYAGAEQQGWLAYNLTNDPIHGLGSWTDEALAQYLSTGQALGHGPASGPMAEAVQHSLRWLTPDDVRAMVVFLRTIPSRSDGPEAVSTPATPATPSDALGARVFAQACAGCHLPNGAGRQSPWAALGGNQTAGDPAGTNLVQVLTHGSQIQTDQGLMFMHAFTQSFTDPELAAVANYVITQFGGREGHVTAKQVMTERSGGGAVEPGS